MRLIQFGIALLFFFSTDLQAQPESTTKSALTFDQLISLDAVSDPRVSPNGQWVAFVVTDYSLETNRGDSDLWLVALKGGQARQLTRGPASDAQPRWAPDSQEIAFVSTRDGSPQIHRIRIDGGEARKISAVETGISNLIWSPDGKWIAFSGDLEWPSPQEGRADPYPTQVKIWTELLFRHWDQWRVGRRSHLFLMPAEGGPVRDLTPIDRDVPTLALGGYHDLSFAPDGQQIAFVMTPDAVPAIGTNNDIFVLPIEGGRMSNLTEHNTANDNNPVYSPDGRWIAYRTQLRSGFESDRYHFMLYERRTGKALDLTPNWSLSVGEIQWAADSRNIYALVEEEARRVVYQVSIEDHSRRRILEDGHHQTLRIDPSGSRLVYTRENARQPDEIYSFEIGSGTVQQLSHINEARVTQLQMQPLESFWFEGAREEKVHGLLLKPPYFDPTSKYPLVYLIHGGPQSAWQDSFHPRWNYQMFAAAGYVVAMVNFHGSTGYGQEFTDSISRHWGDYPYQDLMKGLDFVLDRYDFIDDSKMAAVGASYGGYMVNWIATHSDRFVCLVNHDGVFNLESMYGETEELWFPEWEFGGPPWVNRDLYAKWSPHRFADSLKTPMLIIHGQLDYRVDPTQGLEAFTSLRRKGVPARFVYFPDEGHWVLQPRNRRVWWSEVLSWLGSYLKTQ